MAETQAAVRVVPSGKIYRQLFEAQAQLGKSLERTDKSGSQKVPKSQNVPLVLESRDAMGKSLLQSRQINWLESLPNDSKTENPVFLRHSLERALKEATESSSTKAAREVRSLADTVDVEKQGSDIIERIAESRRLRHETTVEDLHQELTLLANELEPQITEAGSDLLGKLAENDKVIDEILGRIRDDNALKGYTLQQLKELWSEVEQQSSIRRQWITDMSQRIETIEDNRLKRIKHLVKTYAKKLEQIAFLMAPDVQRLIERESQIINQTLLSNQRSYADLFARLMKTDIERDKNHRALWESRVEDWKKLNTDIIIQKFTNFMNDPSITNPPVISDILAELYQEQKAISLKRIDLLNALRSMKPPSSTKSAVYQWNKEIATICQEIERLHTHFLSRLHKEYEWICKECLDQVEKWRLELLQTGVCSDERVQEVVEHFFLPQLGDRQKVFENHLEEIDKSLENLAEMTAHKLRSLFKYAQGAAHLWDVHEINLAKRERELQERLEECRHNHDNINQQMEANLDIILDRLRQESSKEALQKTLGKAEDLLASIKESYHQFHVDQEDIIKAYPESIKTEVGRYDNAVCKFFEVDRIHPKERQKQDKLTASERKPKKIKRRTPLPQSSPHPTDPDRPPSVHSTKSSTIQMKHKWKTAFRRSVNVSVNGRESSLSSVPSPVPMAVKEVLSTSKGTTFYVLTVAGEHGLAEGDSERAGEAAFMTESEEGESQAEVAEYIKNITVPESLFVELRKILRMEFLNHLEDWIDQAAVRANSVVAAKSEELNSELDLRMHLHNPRSQRIEKDIHNVRAAELLLHHDRVTQHSKGVSSALNEIKTRFISMQQEHEELVDKFQKEVDLMEGSFETATKSATLLSLSQQVSSKAETHMEVIRVSLRKFRQYLDQTLQMLRESNARFIKSFKLFSDGGNFSPEEVDTHKKKLEKLANKIDSSEGFVMADLEGMEARRLEQATEIANKFEDRFKNHLFDLTFIEKLTRWLTNTQVKIKGEVADSNAKAQDLMRHLNTLERRVDACKHPNMDKEQITSNQLLACLPSIFAAFEDRATFLNCRKLTTKIHATTPAKVGFAAEGKGQGSPGQSLPVVITTGQKSKSQAEDSAVSLIKNILISQKVTSGQENGEDGDKNGKPNPTSLLIEDNRAKAVVKTPGRVGEKERRPLVKRSTSISLDSNPRRSASGMVRKKDNNLKFDPKYYIFGEKLEKDKHFMALAKRILQDSLDGLLSTADLYYKQKGGRQVTRPQAIHDSFETCADVVVSKLQSYYNQADDYHNQCLQEFREQLEKLECLVAQVPPLVIQDVLKANMKTLRDRIADQARQFHNKYGQLEKLRSEHKALLKPSLGHPQNYPSMKALCDEEEARRQEYENGVQENAEELNRLASQLGEELVQAIASVSEELLKSMDSQIVVDDVEVGRVDPKKLQTSALLRRKQAGLPLTPDEGAPLIQRGSQVWQGMPKNMLVVGDRPSRPLLTAAVTTRSTTLAHKSTVDCRDESFQQYLNEFDKQLVKIEKQKQEQLTAEKRWSDSWQEAVNKVKKLY